MKRLGRGEVGSVLADRATLGWRSLLFYLVSSRKFALLAFPPYQTRKYPHLSFSLDLVKNTQEIESSVENHSICYTSWTATKHHEIQHGNRPQENGTFILMQTPSGALAT